VKADYSPTLSLTSALDGGGWSTPHRGHPWERPGTHCIGDWVGPRAGLDGCGKSRPPPGFDPRTVQPVVSRYTDYTIPTHDISYNKIIIHIYKQWNSNSTNPASTQTLSSLDISVSHPLQSQSTLLQPLIYTSSFPLSIPSCYCHSHGCFHPPSDTISLNAMSEMSHFYELENPEIFGASALVLWNTGTKLF
jgi:hypothetical protein